MALDLASAAPPIVPDEGWPTTVASFDVFDTVLTRRTGAPEAVVDLLARELDARGALGVAPAAFTAARRHHERRLNSLLGRHAELREIYAAAADALSVERTRADAWALAEEDVERRLSVPVPGADALVAAARSEGSRVVFVSDTPHREAFVRELLQAAGLARAEDRVYASATRRVSKSAGGLYECVARELPGHTFRHTGDNRRVDVGGARLHGWSGVHAPAGQLNRYERLHGTLAAGPLGAWLAGSSRLARLRAVERGVDAAVAGVAAGVIAPMLVGYLLWVAGQARQRGIERLYFVARDGQLMHEVAQVLFPVVAPDIECRYLHGSRQAWTLGASACSDDVLRRWLVLPEDFTLRTGLARAGLDPEAVTLPFPLGRGPDAPLSASERLLVTDALLAPPLLDMVQAQAHGAAETAVAYLRQEGLTDGRRAALVDAGWGGATAQAFDLLQAEAGGPEVTHFMLGLLKHSAAVRGHDGPDLAAWLFDAGVHPAAQTGAFSLNHCIEMLCAGTHGRTLGYRSSASGAVEPVLTMSTNDEVLRWGLLDVHATVVDAARSTAAQLTPQDLHTDLTPLVQQLLVAFWGSPSQQELTAWGSFPWEEEIWPTFNPVSQAITLVDVVRRRLRGDPALRRISSWRAGSVAASSLPWRALLTARDLQRHHGARLRRAPRRLRLAWALQERTRRRSGS